MDKLGNQPPRAEFLRIGCRKILWKPITLICLVLFAFGVRAQIRDGGIDPWNLGKGDWIYSITDATNKLGGHVNSVTNENSLMLYYKTQGIRYMVVKAGTAATLFNGCYGFPQFTTKLVNTAHTNGILIFGYNRTYGTNVAGEVAIADFVFNQGADGFVWDAEAEWESGALGTQGPSLAWQQCSQVRSNWPTKFLAHAPFPIIYLHSSFPYKEFGFWCDAVMPQIYHFAATLGSQSAGINWSDINWRTWQNSLAGLAPTNINGIAVNWTNSIKPLAPINDVYGTTSPLLCEGTAAAQADTDVLEFIDYLTADPIPQTVGGYKGVSFWRTDLHGPGQWAYIKAGTSGSFTGIVNNIVIDNPRASTSGTWSSVYTWSNTTTKATFLGDGTGADSDSFGTNYLSNPHGTGANTVQFTPSIVVPGSYNVYQWHPTTTNASAGVPHFINYNGGSATVYANQTTNGGNWTLLGRYDFLAGTSGFVRVSDATLDSGKVAIADGIKLVFVPPASAPAAPGGVSASAMSSSQIVLSWTDLATNETGFVVSGALSSNGPFSTLANLPAGSTGYTNNGLSPNTTYYYSVQATNFLGYSVAAAPVYATTLSGASTDLIIDNTDPAVTFDGVWQTGTSAIDRFGPDYRFASTAAGGQSNVFFRPYINDPGFYDVFIWYPEGSNRATNAPWTVYYDGGSVTVPIDQTTNGGTWVTLATSLPIIRGTNSYVRLSNNTASPGKVVLADAVRWTLSAPNVIHIDSIDQLPDGRARLQASGGPGRVGIDGSSNLLSWTELTNFILNGSSFIFLDPDTNQIARFYRMRLMP